MNKLQRKVKGKHSLLVFNRQAVKELEEILRRCRRRRHWGYSSGFDTPAAMCSVKIQKLGAKDIFFRFFAFFVSILYICSQKAAKRVKNYKEYDSNNNPYTARQTYRRC